MRAAWNVLRESYAGFSKHQDGRLAAALAYYAVFSLAPLLLIVIALVGLFLGESNAERQVQGELQTVVGVNGVQFINVLIAGSAHHNTGRIALIVGGALVLFSAIGMFLALQNALDEVFEIKPGNRGGFVGLVILRLHALLVIVVLAFVAIGALALVNVIGGVMQTSLGARFAAVAFEIGSAIVNVVAMTVFLAVVYRVLPQCPVLWKSAFTGAVVTAAILLAGEAVLSLYFTRLHPAAPYGAAGGIVVLLLWIYYSAQLMLFGAEITSAIQRRKISAVRLRREESAA
jgi:membrane protein